jgi:hypothetical protein
MASQNPTFRPKSDPHAITVNGKEAIIWGDPASIAAMFGSIPKYSAPAGKLIQVRIPARSCKRYPSDPGYTIPAVTATRYNKVNPKKNAALPGRVFTGARPTGLQNQVRPTDRIYNFRIQGAWATLKAWYTANHDGTAVLWSPSGHPTTFTSNLQTADQSAESVFYG